MLTLILYTLFITICVCGWFSVRSYKIVENQRNITLSAVICCKNEEKNLPFLLHSLKNQLSDIEQIIFANDNSTDETLKILQEFSEIFPNINIFSTGGFGKKNALKEAMQFVESEYVITFDADCVVPQNYFLPVKNFLAQNQPDLMIGGVKMHTIRHCGLDPQSCDTRDTCFSGCKNEVWVQIQALEFASLIASGAGAALAKMPVMCNGANLAFRKEVWQDAENDLVTKEVSGDDVFLLHYVKKNGGKILFFKAKNAFVKTFAVKKIGEFLIQRQRWASKSKSYSDKQTIFVALLVFMINFLIIFSAIGAFFSVNLLQLFLFAFFFKMLLDSILSVPFLIFTNQKNLIKFIPILSIIYPFYIVFTAIFGFFGKIKWK